ncbi:MAG: hypothetical protein JST64_00875 [Actinobacteria bacterium]|nr:hypothetical protein [Actinomycetota bacterium]
MSKHQSPNPNEIADAEAAYTDAVAARANLDERIAAGDNAVTATDIIEADALIATRNVELDTARRLAGIRRDIAAEQDASEALRTQWAELGSALPAHVDAIADAFDSAVVALEALNLAVVDYNGDANARRSGIVAAATGARVMFRDERGLPIPGDTSVAGIDWQAIDCITSTLEPVDLPAITRQAIDVAGSKFAPGPNTPLIVDLPHRDKAAGTIEAVQHKLEADPYGGQAVASLLG